MTTVSPQVDVERNSGGAPPPFDSICSRLKSVKDQSSGPKDCIENFAKILCGSVFVTVLIGLVLAIPLSMIIVGALHTDDCPADRYLPIYLIVGGCFGVVQSIMTTFFRIKNHLNKKNDDFICPNPVSVVVFFFLFAWFIAGSAWVYQIYDEMNTTDPKLGNYNCHGGTFWFTIVIISAGYVSMALAICCILIMGAVAWLIG